MIYEFLKKKRNSYESYTMFMSHIRYMLRKI